MNLKEKITSIIEEWLVGNPSLFLVDILISNKGKQKILVLLDGDKGVSIDHCAGLSRRIGYILEQENTIEDAYILEVSSPGVDYPLKLQRQYAANTGRKLKIELVGGNVLEGIISAVDDKSVTLEFIQKKLSSKAKKLAANEPAPETHRQIGFEEIKKALVQINFNE
jgi:ribosome maturation factor RimP